MALDSIHHVAVSVADIEKSVHWYLTSFRCELLEQGRQHAVLQFANLRVVLTLPSLDPPHLAFERDDAASLGELRTRVDGVRSTFLADSSGNLIEIVGPPEKFEGPGSS